MKIRALCLFFLSLWASSVSAQAATVTLTANPTTGISPLSTTLTWNATGFGASATCTASGATVWTGTKALAGTQTISLGGGTFALKLDCADTVGNATLTWTAPTQNEDLTPISAVAPGALAGFEILHATTAAGVPTATPVILNDKTLTTYTLTGLPVGARYYAMKAFNTEGIRSNLTGTVNNVIVAPAASATASVTVNVKPKPPVLSTTIASIYEVVPDNWNGVRLGRLVGTAPVGSPCIDTPVDTNKGTYYPVDNSLVTFSKPPKSEVVVTKCEWVG